MRKVVCLLSFLLVVALAGNAFGWAEWQYSSGSHSWGNAANWDTGVPTAADDPIMRDHGAAGYAEVGPSVNAVGNMMWMYGGGQADLNVNGGNLTLSQLRIAVDDGVKTVNVSSGSVNLSSDSTVGQGGTGNLNVTGGSFTNTGWTYVGYGGTGHIAIGGGGGGGAANFGPLRLWNGSMTVSNGTVTVGSDMTVGESGAFDLTMTGGSLDQTAGWLYVGFGAAGGVHLNGGLLSINSLQLDGSAGEYFDMSGDGTLKIKDARPEDIAWQINWYASQGYLTVNGHGSAVGMLDITTEPVTNYTIVKVIPEPVTMLLLGLGGLFIRRR